MLVSIDVGLVSEGNRSTKRYKSFFPSLSSAANETSIPALSLFSFFIHQPIYLENTIFKYCVSNNDVRNPIIFLVGSSRCCQCYHNASLRTSLDNTNASPKTTTTTIRSICPEDPFDVYQTTDEQKTVLSPLRCLIVGDSRFIRNSIRTLSLNTESVPLR